MSLNDDMRTAVNIIQALDEELRDLDHGSIETTKLKIQSLRIEAESAALSAEAATLRLEVAKQRHAEEVARRKIIDRREDAVTALEATRLKLLESVNPTARAGE